MNQDSRQSGGVKSEQAMQPDPETEPASKFDPESGLFDIQVLLRPQVYPHPVKHCELIETHISWVILTGDFAYKIKKPVNLGFLDFSTLAKRLFFCQEELRLNRRLAADIYLDIVALAGSPEKPVITALQGNKNHVMDYAVKMRQFSQQAQLDRMLQKGELRAEHIDAFAERVADFHQQADVAGKAIEYGDPERVRRPVQENFAQIRDQISKHEYDAILEELELWEGSEFESLKLVLQQRKKAGFIREGHGDMHLRNLAWIDHKPVLFDCIEFNPELRWIDVISDIAFLVMDLQDRQQPQLAQRFLNDYLERTGDYAGVTVLPYYLFYRAMVRAKVDAIRAGQAGISPEEKSGAEKDLAAYLALAQGYTQRAAPVLIITRGLSASGKTTITQTLLEQLGAIRIRSDVERKRLFGLKANQEAKADTGKGIYTSSATVHTYGKLAELADKILEAGYSVIVDATFLKNLYVEQFAAIAKKKQVLFSILVFNASAQTLRQRIMNRKQGASDADLAVLEQQLKQQQELSDRYGKNVININTEELLDFRSIIEKIIYQAPRKGG
ncbi:FIG00496272: hypothetical protein [hydrothermal vent metagenome]|uniref:Aminoglycoside phosphotransferase domain-containing protein n=1 Tax=hydrothermal vent metagenome TaxID=652676 RepID=A0A3B1BD93_9ZZZZ